jgi:hypothetical protein
MLALLVFAGESYLIAVGAEAAFMQRAGFSLSRI